MKAKKYPNLYKKAGQVYWVFSKYSAARGGEFRVTTDYEATEANASAAYKDGMRRFNDWMGSAAIRVRRDPLVRDIAKIAQEGKKAKAPDTVLKIAIELKNHILPAFGHLRPSQITALRLQQYENGERAKGRTSLFNTRKYLFEILNLAKSEGLIRELPTWKLSDPKPKAPKFIDAATFRKIRRLVKGPEKLVLFILYYQGARPREALQYRWEMIRKDGTIHIPSAITKTRRARVIPLNSRVARVLRWMKRASGPLFRSKTDANRSRVVYDRGWLDAVRELGLDFEIYNLRDSFITRQLQSGVSPIYIARYVDSSVREIEKRYAVTMPDIMRQIAG